MKKTDDTFYIFDQLAAPLERVCGMTICLHTYSNSIESLVSHKKASHHNEYCYNAKDRYGKDACMSFDLKAVQQHLTEHPEGFFKQCHAEYIECVVPIREGNTVLGAIFAGLFKASEDLKLKNMLKPTKKCRRYKIIKQLVNQLPVLDNRKAEDIFQLILMLKSRLEEYIISRQQHQPVKEHHLKIDINEFLRLNFTQDIKLEALAKHINLSVSRTSHVIKELYGINYPELLKKYRIEHSKYLLSHTALPICQISADVGFTEAGYFHRLFKESCKLTPGQYRKQNKQSQDI